MTATTPLRARRDPKKLYNDFRPLFQLPPWINIRTSLPAAFLWGANTETPDLLTCRKPFDKQYPGTGDSLKSTP